MKTYAYLALFLTGAVVISANPFENAPLGPDGRVIDTPEVHAAKLAHFAMISDFVKGLNIPHTFGTVTEYLRKSPAELEAIIEQQNPGLTTSLEKVDSTRQNGHQFGKEDAFLNSQHPVVFRSSPIKDHTIPLELQLPKVDSPSPFSKSESYHFASSAVASSNAPGSLHIEWGSNKRLGQNAPVVDSGSKDFVLNPQDKDLHVIFDKLYGDKNLINVLKNDNSGKPDENSAVHSSISNRFVSEAFESPNKGDNNQFNVKGSHFSSQSSHSFSYQGASVQS